MSSPFHKSRGAALRVSLLASLVLGGIHAGTTQAHSGPAGALPASAAERARAVTAVLGDDARRRPNGLIRIRTDRAGQLTTHGPDLRSYSAEQPGFRPGDPERKPVCATDYYQRIFYAYPRSKRPSDAAAEIAEIRAIVRRMNAVLNADSIEAGGPSADYKVLCDSSGRIRVDAIGLRDLDVSSVIDTATAAIGLLDLRADHTIFLDAPDAGWCAIGTFWPDDSAGVGNRNNSGGGYAVIERGCWQTLAPMHENGHNQGAVQYGAPSSTGLGSHCAVDYDVMCYSPDGGDLRQGGTTLRCKDRIHFDCGFDDYFDSAPEPGEYLSKHWNVGSRDNRFIDFSPRSGADPAMGVPTRESARLKVRFKKKPKRKIVTRHRRKEVKFKFTASEPRVKYRCRVDRRRWRRCTSPKKVKLGKGWHRFRVRAVDAAGNRSKIKKAKFKITRRRG